MAKAGRTKPTGQVKPPPKPPGLSDRDLYVLDKAPVILQALSIRRDSRSANQLTDVSIDAAGHIWDVVMSEPGRASNDYLLDHIPTVMTGIMMRRVATQPHDLIPMALSQVERIWDVVHELDVPATAMMSMPVSLDGHPPAQ